MPRTRVRREPPPFRRVEVVRKEPRSPYLVRITLAGSELEGFDPGLPAASLRLLLPEEGNADIEVPAWNGNEFRAADGSRPRIRTLTPLRFDPDGLELDVEIVLHGDSPLTVWAQGAGPGTPAAVSGTGRGTTVDVGASAWLVAGDESALPAISVLLPALAEVTNVAVLIEVRNESARVDLPVDPRTSVRWCVAEPGIEPGAALLEAVRAAGLPDGVQVWAAGEAAAVQRIRRYLFDGVGLARNRAIVRGYWRLGRVGDEDG